MNGDSALDPRIALAAFLVQLGVVTVQQIRDAFRKDEDDDARLAAIMAQVDARIARRS